MSKLAAFVLALMLAACGGGKGDTQAEATTKPEAMPPAGDPLWAIPPDRSPLWQKIDPVTLKPV